jgi:hypothetical protein
MTAKDIRKKIISGEIDINATENFFSKLIKGLMYDLVDSIKVRGKSVPHLILNTGDDIMYLEVKGQDMSIEPTEVSNEKFVYNYVPRGVVTPGGIDILTDQLTSPYTRGQFQFDYDDTLYTFTAEFRRMPLKVNTTIKYYLDNFTDTLELTQYIITHLNFIKNYQIIYMGQTIPCSYRFPENLEGEYNAEFDGLSQDSKYRTVEVQLEIETNIPVFYPRTAIEADLTISGEYFYVVEYDGDHIFNTENAAEEFIKEHPDGILKRIKKTLWNKRPVFQDGEIVDIKDIKEQMMEKIMVRK